MRASSGSHKTPETENVLEGMTKLSIPTWNMYGVSWVLSAVGCGFANGGGGELDGDTHAYWLWTLFAVSPCCDRSRHSCRVQSFTVSTRAMQTARKARTQAAQSRDRPVLQSVSLHFPGRHQVVARPQSYFHHF